MYLKGKINQVEWDMNTITAADYTVELKINKESYIEWSKEIYKTGDKQREIPVTFSLKEYMIKFIEEKLTAEWIKYKQG